jgi:hypothetical protein
VIYGSADGLTATGNQFLREGANGAAGSAEANDHFGWSLASGDFNGDDFSDLAVGVPNEDYGGKANPGQVYIFNGSANGLSFHEVWDSRNFGLSGADYTQFGYSLVWRDFNADSFGDLAIGSPGFDYVDVLYGDSTGLALFGTDFLVWDRTSTHRGFGQILSAGDYNGDNVDDLAVSAPYLHVEFPFCVCVLDAIGAVVVFSGSAASGLDAGEYSEIINPAPENYDRFGSALASGDFNGDGKDDLAIGVPAKKVDGLIGAGRVYVYSGSALGFGTPRSLTQGTAAETGDGFGFALAAGDFDRDGRKDLAVGSPGEDHGSTIDNGGIVQIFAGTANGLISSASQVWHEDIDGVIGTAQAGDQFGYALSAWDFGNGPYADLVIGVPFQDITGAQTIRDVGKVHVPYGSTAGLTADNDQQWLQNSLCCSTSEEGDQFGYAVY